MRYYLLLYAIHFHCSKIWEKVKIAVLCSKWIAKLIKQMIPHFKALGILVRNLVSESTLLGEILFRPKIWQCVAALSAAIEV